VCGLEIRGVKHGPYNGNKRYVCDHCWRNASLFFPDKKVFTESFRFRSVLNSSENFKYARDRSLRQVKGLSIKEVSKYRLSITPERAIEADLMDIPLDNLKLDPENVRFRHIMRTLSEQEMIEWIWKETETKKLYQQVKFSQGLQEQPIVDSGFVVKEGNMRVVCLLKLRDEIQNGEITNIPIEKIDPVRCIVLPKKMDDTEISILLTRVHVAGKTPWRALNQAAQVYDLHNKHGYSFDKIADSCGMGKVTAMRMVDAYEQTLAYHEKHSDDQLWVSRFSYFYELLKRKQLKDWVADPDNVEKFMEWVSAGQIEKGAEVRDLPDIIAVPSAYEKLLDGGRIGDALKVVAQENPAITSKSFKIIEKATEELKTFPRNELIDTIKNPAKMRMLEELHSELESIIADIKSVSEKS